MTRYVVDILEELEETQGTNAKRDILEASKKNELLKFVFVAAQDPYTVYYVTKFKAPRPAEQTLDSDETLRKFLVNLTENLATRKVTGNAARELVIQHFAKMTLLEQKWCQRILLHNLRCGVQESTVNKVWPGLINSFSVALAHTLKSQFTLGIGIEILDSVNYPVRVEPKLDGLRCIAVKKNGKVTFFTRNGTILESMPRIKSILEAAAYDNVVLDGEGMATDWNESASVMMSKTQKDDSNLYFNVFDAISLQDWVSQKSTITYCKRVNLVSNIVECCNNQHVRQVDHIMAKNETELKTFFAKCMDEGYEGVMLKTLHTSYEWGRSKNILKLKPCSTYEGTIVGWYEGRQGTKNQGKFGGFYVLLSNGVVTRVGGGYTNTVRAEIQLETPEAWLGRIVECEAQPDPLTKDGLTIDGKMRFPVYVRVRNNVDVDQRVVTSYLQWKNMTRAEQQGKLPLRTHEKESV